MKTPFLAALLALLVAVPLRSQEPAANPAATSSPQTAGATAASPDLDADVHKLDIKAGMHPPKAISQPEAEYSDTAREKRLNGRCSISMIVDAKGLPKNVHIVRCTDPVFAPMSTASTSRYRFRPATMADGTPVAVSISVVVDFRIDGGREINDPIRLGFGSPPRAPDSAPDANGIYTFSKAITPPTITRFVDEGYSSTAFARDGKSPCELILTLDVKGKPTSAVPSNCEPEVLAKGAAKTLLASHFKPATLQGKAVPVRILAHLEYAEFATAQESP
jgi:hypothetical protein